MYTYMHDCRQANVCVHLFAIQNHTYIHAHIDRCTHIQVNTHVYMYTYTHISTHIPVARYMW